MESIWKETVSLPEFPQAEGNLNTDVLIVGGGMAGVLCARKLTDAGVDCILIEGRRIGGGITGNTTAKITSQHGLIYGKLLKTLGDMPARMYYEANAQAVSDYRELAGTMECDFRDQDNFIYSRDSRAELEEEMAALNRLGIPGELVENLPLSMETAGAVCFRGQAMFHPLKFLRGIAEGLRIYEDTWAREFAGNLVITDRGSIRAKKIIIATHFPIINKHGGYFIKQYQQRSYVAALEGAELPEGMYLGAGKDDFSFRTWENLLLLGGGGHRTGKKSQGWQPLEEFAGKYYPEARMVCKWAAQDCMSLDAVPYVGRYGKNTPDLYVATGFNKWGMTGSMVAASLLKDLILDRENPYSQLFSPARSSLHPQLLCNGAESVMNLLRPTGPRCPHLGCALRWNPYEHSWDCPCHGSRFRKDGKLLDNPATDDLYPD